MLAIRKSLARGWQALQMRLVQRQSLRRHSVFGNNFRDEIKDANQQELWA